MMRAAIYARYSSENQRPESIDDQIASCRRKAGADGLLILETHVYTDRAQSGAQQDRSGLNALREGARNRLFDVVLVDDLSRLARSVWRQVLLPLNVNHFVRFGKASRRRCQRSLRAEGQRTRIGSGRFSEEAEDQAERTSVCGRLRSAVAERAASEGMSRSLPREGLWVRGGRLDGSSSARVPALVVDVALL